MLRARIRSSSVPIGDELDKIDGTKVLFYVGFDLGGGLGEAYVGQEEFEVVGCGG